MNVTDLRGLLQKSRTSCAAKVISSVKSFIATRQPSLSSTTVSSIDSPCVYVYAKLLDIDNVVSLGTTSKPCILSEYDKDISTGHPDKKKSSVIDVVGSVDKYAVELAEILDSLLARDCHKDVVAVLAEREIAAVFTVPTVLSERLGDNGGILVLALLPSAAAFFKISNAMLTLNLSSAELSIPIRSFVGEPVVGVGAYVDLVGGMMVGTLHWREELCEWSGK